MSIGSSIVIGSSIWSLVTDLRSFSPDSWIFSVNDCLIEAKNLNGPSFSIFWGLVSSLIGVALDYSLWASDFLAEI